VTADAVSSTPTGPARGHRTFAALYEWSSGVADRRGQAGRRAQLVGDLRGSVLEIGIGNGRNLAHYRQIDRLAAVEPDPQMLKRLRPRLAQVTFPVDLRVTGAERLPFPDASFDAVVASLVFCTIPDPLCALAEVRRVLRPDGTFRFMEHVRGEGWPGRVLDIVAPVWALAAGGCHPNRRTEQSIWDAGFTITAIERYVQGSLPHIQGSAIRSR
jgi:SAM-dependent methyltransferase